MVCNFSGYGLLVTLCTIMHLQLLHSAEVSTDCSIIYSICYIQNDLKVTEGDSLKIIAYNADTIKELYFNQNSQLGSIPYGIFDNFPELELISISQSGINILQSDRLVNAKNLQSLRLDDNDIKVKSSLTLLQCQQYIYKITKSKLLKIMHLKALLIYEP